MSGHTNRNKRNGGNPRSRHGPQRQRGSDGRASQPTSQPKNGISPSTGQESQPKSQASEPTRDTRDQGQGQSPQHPHPQSQPPAQEVSPPASAEVDQHSEVEAGASAGDSAHAQSRQEPANPRGRPPFASAVRGSHAYIPASGPRPGVSGQNGQNGGQNGQNGQNGHRSPNGDMPHTPLDRRTEPPVSAGSGDDGRLDDAGDIPQTWRIERLNGGTDTTPRETFRPESRGEVGSLIDALHDLFARDRAVASQSDSTRCGICYLHYPMNELEYREAEGFFVCAGCKRALGYEQLMMVRRQQSPHAG